MNRPSSSYSEPDLHPPWPQVARVVIILVAAAGLVVSALSYWVGWDAMAMPCAEGDEACLGVAFELGQTMEAVGIPLTTMRAISTISALVLVTAYFAVGGLILWRRSNSKIGVLTAFWLIMLGPAALSGDYFLLIERFPAIRYPTAFLNAASLAFFIPFLFLFPNGRFVPGWTRWLVYISMPVMLLATELYGLPDWVMAIGFPVVIVNILIGMIAQIIRYRKYATRGEQEQTRLVLFGVTFLALLLILLGILLAIMPGQSAMVRGYAMLGYTVALPLGLLAIPLTIGMSLLRYRLWEVDLIIRRTLQYTILSGLLGLFYFGSVILMQGVFGGLLDDSSPLVVIVSTLLIASLFAPLRRQVQDFIDRRFYRRKYDAEQALARFSLTARDYVDIEELVAELLNVVDEMMHPEQLSLWIKEQPEK